MAKMKLDCTINGSRRTVESEPDRTLLEVLREDLQLTGTKYGCGEGACGACTVLVDGRRTLSCATPVEDVRDKTITTIEGLAPEGELHPVQEAFLAEGAFQCGYCTPGMILSAVSLLSDMPDPSESQIRQAMNGNVCRCCGYPGMVRAVRRAAEGERKEVALED